jgi:Xaa-Pro aminopeptidase
MPILSPHSTSLIEILKQRRQRLANQFSHPAVIWSGQPVARNFPANTHPFRANSHFLYFAGLSLANAAIYLDQGRLMLFMDDVSPEAALWHGPSLSRAAIATALGADVAYPLAALTDHLKAAAILPSTDQQQHYQATIGGPVAATMAATNQRLAAAIVDLRLSHDTHGIGEIATAAAVSVEAHRAGMAATVGATTEAEVRAAMEGVIMAHDMACAYNSIVTVHGEVLHNQQYHHGLTAGDLLLADVGAEATTGWASDITRTWPVSGRFSAAQRDLYDLVLAAHDACIAAMQPGVEYRDLHLLSSRILAAGLVELGVLRGSPDDLVDRDVHALFFPHGVGHLLGLDVHDMEDLGDLAGYAPGRQRSDRFGLAFLRLDRPLQPNMVVTIEPGFYQVPAILEPARQSGQYGDAINWERLDRFEGVRGIRIEDDVLVTDGGCRVLTAALPTAPADIEALVSR